MSINSSVEFVLVLPLLILRATAIYDVGVAVVVVVACACYVISMIVVDDVANVDVVVAAARVCATSASCAFDGNSSF